MVAVGAFAWGLGRAGDADLLASDARSYRRLLDTLGGEDFHIGTLEPAAGEEVAGQVLLYEGDANRGWSSWGVLFVHAPGRTSTATATLLSEDGRTLELPELEFEEGESAVWVVEDDLGRYDRLAVTAADGSLLATASITEA